MQIEQNKVVSIDYSVKTDDGALVDSSEGREPLQYIQGRGNIIGGLEKALEGKAQGDAVEARIAPEDAYGEYSEDMVQSIDRSHFGDAKEIEPGMQFQARTPAGVQVMTVKEVHDDKVTVDGNHPLAGQALNFDVKIVDVRDATEKEIERGHVHHEGCEGGCGCDH